MTQGGGEKGTKTVTNAGGNRPCRGRNEIQNSKK